MVQHSETYLPELSTLSRKLDTSRPKRESQLRIFEQKKPTPSRGTPESVIVFPRMCPFSRPIMSYQRSGRPARPPEASAAPPGASLLQKWDFSAKMRLFSRNGPGFARGRGGFGGSPPKSRSGRVSEPRALILGVPGMDPGPKMSPK